MTIGRKLTSTSKKAEYAIYFKGSYSEECKQGMHSMKAKYKAINCVLKCTEEQNYIADIYKAFSVSVPELL
jgi:hypothetical protein